MQFAASSDATKGYGYGVIRTGDNAWNTATVVDQTVTTGTPIAGIVDNDTVYIKIELDAEHGVWYGDISETGVWA